MCTQLTCIIDLNLLGNVFLVQWPVSAILTYYLCLAESLYSVLLLLLLILLLLYDASYYLYVWFILQWSLLLKFELYVAGK
jgi:hypothetical protein